MSTTEEEVQGGKNSSSTENCLNLNQVSFCTFIDLFSESFDLTELSSSSKNLSTLFSQDFLNYISCSFSK